MVEAKFRQVVGTCGNKRWPTSSTKGTIYIDKVTSANSGVPHISAGLSGRLKVHPMYTPTLSITNSPQPAGISYRERGKKGPSSLHQPWKVLFCFVDRKNEEKRPASPASSLCPLSPNSSLLHQPHVLAAHRLHPSSAPPCIRNRKQYLRTTQRRITRTTHHSPLAQPPDPLRVDATTSQP